MKLADVSNPAIPANMGSPSVDPVSMASNLAQILINLIFVVGAISFVFMLLFGGYQWITSGGDKEGLQKARSRITHALVGLIVLFSIYAALSLLESFLGVNLTIITIPT